MIKSVLLERPRLATKVTAETVKKSLDTAVLLDNAAYARQHGLPTKTSPKGWYGNTRALLYTPPFRDSFAALSQRHQRQVRIYLTRFAEEGALYTSAKIETINPQRGWIAKIPKGVKKYRCGRISAFLRFAYNLIGDDSLILYNLGKKSEHV